MSPRYGLFLLSTTALAACCWAAVPPPPSSVDVFTPGMTSTDGTTYACIRIPAIVLDRNSGTLLAFAECRHRVGDGCVPRGAKTGPGVDLCARVSKDAGQTWGPLRTLATNAGQPTATFDVVRNRTVLEFNQKSGSGCVAGTSCCPAFQIVSSDGGQTWSSRREVVPVHAVAWPARVGPGRGIQLRADNPHSPGRLLNIGWHSAANGSRAASFDAVYFSDDGAATWRQPTQPRQLNTPCDEAQLAELPNGDILAVMRPSVRRFSSCPRCRQLSLSTDGGRTWGWDGVVGAVHPEPALNGAVCMAGVLSDETAVYASYPNSSTGSRSAGAIRVSTDNAKSWHDHVAFGGDAVLFAYSCLTEMPGERGHDELGILWETGADDCVGPSCKTVFSVVPKVAGQRKGASTRSTTSIKPRAYAGDR